MSFQGIWHINGINHIAVLAWDEELVGEGLLKGRDGPELDLVGVQVNTDVLGGVAAIRSHLQTFCVSDEDATVLAVGGANCYRDWFESGGRVEPEVNTVVCVILQGSFLYNPTLGSQGLAITRIKKELFRNLQEIGIEHVKPLSLFTEFVENRN